MVKNRLASTLLERAMAFYQARLWTSYTGDEVVKLVLPEDHPALIASIMGHDEPPQGLNTYLGARALEDCAEILGSNKSHYEDHTDCYLLGFGIDRLASIPGVQREVLEAAGFKGRREALAPWFYAKS
ncbi:MAG: hypothetical protein KDB53_08215, partial [Planctomycetes bacterium]|nr:hypothetical protein [Planctomycetota bacterium]